MVEEQGGWYVVNVKDANWVASGDFGDRCSLETKGPFPQTGVRLAVIGPGQPNCRYHRENAQEDFLVLSGEAHVLYKCSDIYRPELERGVVYNDPSLAIDWPGGDAAPLERRLRLGVPPIVGRVQEGQLLLDLRTVLPAQDEMLVEHLRLLKTGKPAPLPVYDFARHVRMTATEWADPRPVILLDLCIGNVRKKEEVNLVDRRGMNYELLIGRNFLKDEFLIDPGATYSLSPDCAG